MLSISKKHIACFALFIGVAMAVGIFWEIVYNNSHVHRSNNCSSKKFTMCNSKIISDEDLRKIEISAANGDDKAAFFLSEYYTTVNEADLSLKWLSIAANRGSCRSILSLISSDESENNTEYKKKWEEKYNKYNCTKNKFIEEAGS